MDNYEILAELDKLVFGHEIPKKVLINMINRSKLRYIQRYKYDHTGDDLVSTSNCLLIGGSGTGKTHLVQSLSKIMHFPLIKLDATSFTHTSAKGMDVQAAVSKIKKEAAQIFHENKHLYFSMDGVLEQLIVFVDEVDKLANMSGERWNEATQANYLQLFENRTELTGLTFIFAGAFSGMEYRQQAEAKNSIGFTKTKETKNVDILDDIDQKVTNYGLMPELVGRMGQIVVLDELSEDDYREILLNNLLPKKQYEMFMMGHQGFDLTDPQIDDIVKKAKKSGQGVRHLKASLERVSIDTEFHITISEANLEPSKSLVHNFNEPEDDHMSDYDAWLAENADADID